MSGIFDQIINYSPPLIVSGTVNYKGTWNASTNNPTLSASPASSTKGDYYVVSTAGTQFGITFAIGDWIISNGTAWEKVDLTDAVSSVFGRTGAVVGVSTDYSAVGLTNTAIGASNPSTGAFTTVTASSTISATGAVTGSNLSGTNTGDQTTITGNAGTATALQTARTIGGSSFNGTANVTSFPVPGAIGVTTPAAANFTSIGVTTQGTGAFTTGNFSSTLFAGGVTTLRGANVPIANNSGFLIVGSSDAAGADLGGSLGFTANTTSLANYPMGNISARLIATGAGVYRSYMAFATTTSAGAVNEYMRLTDAGLAVTGALSATGGITSTFDNSSAQGINIRETTNASGAFFTVFRKADSTAIGSVARVTTTDAVVYNTTSDSRLKENFRDFTDSGRLIDSLKPRVFDWKNSDKNGKNVVGFIAQEEHAADPIFAHIGAVSVGDEDPETITKQWQRSDAALIPILVAELKALRQRVAALEA